eukprot:TRINITY_DN4203_c0_g1_i1.p1 TRINITY_DN4203_c0_g1~~TRINITY_DN4203_c0_g1_i1.p1  ORF type:complete len:505 (+),score=95.56 TRINITY_DN4203_c0_g1_i1:30-1544(+)
MPTCLSLGMASKLAMTAFTFRMPSARSTCMASSSVYFQSVTKFVAVSGKAQAHSRAPKLLSVGGKTGNHWGVCSDEFSGYRKLEHSNSLGRGLRNQRSFHWQRAQPLCAAASDKQVNPVYGEDTRVPVTVITGFLGSGKTTLLNHVLTAEHGKRIAVIENEFGEVDIDGSLVAAQRAGAEDIVMLNNGCLCCTVRGDLVRMLAELVKTKRDRFDHIIIETTGLANPAPVIQTFFMEDRIADDVKLDGVVTVVDCKHVGIHMDEVKPEGVVNEAVEQIAFADRIILNKTDLVNAKELESVRRRITRINAMARLQSATYGQVDMDYVLGIGGFDLERIEKDVEEELAKAEAAHDHHHEHEHKHEHNEDCAPGCGHDHSHDHNHAHAHSHDHEHDHGHDHVHDHVHDPGVGSVSIVCGGELDLELINNWLGDLLAERSDDIFRMKGVLAIKGSEERFVFQGVHALFEGSPEKPWKPEDKRLNKLVFIGRDLNEEELRSGFMSCIIKA